jgi:hypothetical protein
MGKRRTRLEIKAILVEIEKWVSLVPAVTIVMGIWMGHLQLLAIGLEFSFALIMMKVVWAYLFKLGFKYLVEV